MVAVRVGDGHESSGSGVGDSAEGPHPSSLQIDDGAVQVDHRESRHRIDSGVVPVALMEGERRPFGRHELPVAIPGARLHTEDPAVPVDGAVEIRNPEEHRVEGADVHTGDGT